MAAGSWFADLHYTSANQLAIVDSFGPTHQMVRYVYDGLGRLAEVRNASGSTVLTRFYYDGANLVHQTDGSGGEAVSYQWANGRLLSQQQEIGGSAKSLWYISDVLGNVRGIVDQEPGHELVAHYMYDAFGNVLESSFENLPVPNPFRYRGTLGYRHLMDVYDNPVSNVTSSLCLAGARVYHTGIGRWLQEDPILGITGDPMSFNRYLYCNANPVDNSDPLGLSHHFAPMNLVFSGYWDCIQQLGENPFVQNLDWIGFVGLGYVHLGLARAVGGGVVRTLVEPHTGYWGGPFTWYVCIGLSNQGVDNPMPDTINRPGYPPGWPRDFDRVP
jgi:RHS repeat-associated protein